MGLGSLTAAMKAVGTVWILELLSLVNLDILFGVIFDSPIRGVPEIVSMSIVGSVFIQLGYTLRIKRLTRIYAFLGWLESKNPRAKAALEAS